MEASKGNGSSCAVKYCNNKSRTTVGVSYFTMPKNVERRSNWIEQCMPQFIDKNAFIQNLRVCSKHFENKMFLNVHKKNKLTDFGVPTLFNDEILVKRAAESDLHVNESIDLSTPMACSSPIASTSTRAMINSLNKYNATRLIGTPILLPKHGKPVLYQKEHYKRVHNFAHKVLVIKKKHPDLMTQISKQIHESVSFSDTHNTSTLTRSRIMKYLFANGKTPCVVF